MNERELFQTAIYAAAGLLLLVIIAHRATSGAGKAQPGPRRDGAAAWCVYWLLGLSVIVLGGSGLNGALADGLAGWPLLLHVAAAPLFLLASMLAGLIWGGRCRFGMFSGFWPSEKLVFWTALLAALLSGGSMMAAMSSSFGYAEQVRLITLHRYSGLVLLVLSGLHVYLAASRRISARS